MYSTWRVRVLHRLLSIRCLGANIHGLLGTSATSTANPILVSLSKNIEISQCLARIGMVPTDVVMETRLDSDRVVCGVPQVVRLPEVYPTTLGLLPLLARHCNLHIQSINKVVTTLLQPDDHHVNKLTGKKFDCTYSTMHHVTESVIFHSSKTSNTQNYTLLPSKWSITNCNERVHFTSMPFMFTDSKLNDYVSSEQVIYYLILSSSKFT